jgi:methyltransferase (TIGR00027 family)
MIDGLPSLTALYVALGRGVATHEVALSRACHDPYAGQLLPAPLGALVWSAACSRFAARALRYGSFGMFDHHAMRTGLIDGMLEAAVDRGARQLVLLGAGLDTRGHRVPGLSDVVVFEVDHASTQGYKRRRAKPLAQRAREIRYVACDFEQLTFEDALQTAGFDPTIPSCVIWEGVTMYLVESAFERSLEALSALCAPRSTLILTYVTASTHRRSSAAWAPVHAMLSAIAEPIRFTCDANAMAGRLDKHGFRALSDAQPSAQKLAFGIKPLPFPLKNPLERERVVCSERTEHASSPRR